MTPRKPPTSRTERQHQLRVWISRSEFKRLCDDATKRGETVSTVVRQRIAAPKTSPHLRRAVSPTSRLHKK
jgi:hypothetical protein